MRTDTTVTPDELAFLVSLSGGASPLAEELAIPTVKGLDDPHVLAGLQSLVAREFARTDGEVVSVDTEVGSIGIGLGFARRSVLVVLESTTGMSSGRLVEGGDFRLWLTPRPPGLTNAAVLDSAPPLQEVLASIVETFLGDASSQAVTIGVELPSHDSPAGLVVTKGSDSTTFRLSVPDRPDRAGTLGDPPLVELCAALFELLTAEEHAGQ